MAAKRVLLVDDEALFRTSVARRLEKEGLAVCQAATLKDAAQLLPQGRIDVAVVDQKLPDGSGVDLLKKLQKKYPSVPVILITGFSSVDGAVEAIKLGAYDYLTKPVTLDKLLLVIRRAIEASTLRSEVTGARESQARRFGLENIIAKDPSMQRIVRLARQIARSDARTLMLRGESGSGKSLLARAIHYESPRRDQPFVQITCTTLQDTLLESELFGHERGAFTDAKTLKPGLFEIADGGTVFLDEISEMSDRLQAKLLQVLDEQTFRRLGGVKDLAVNVRVIAATNRDLEKLVRDGAFRADLYYRLNIVPIHVPPLRERRSDVAELAARFIANYNGEFRKSVTGISPEGMEILMNHSWPGNVRELKNVIERAVLLATKPVLEPSDLVIVAPVHPQPRTAFCLPEEGLVLEEVEKDLIRQALARTEGSYAKSARLLGVTKDVLRYRAGKYGLVQRERDAGRARRHIRETKTRTLM